MAKERAPNAVLLEVCEWWLVPVLDRYSIQQIPCALYSVLNHHTSYSMWKVQGTAAASIVIGSLMPRLQHIWSDIIYGTVPEFTHAVGAVCLIASHEKVRGRPMALGFLPNADPLVTTKFFFPILQVLSLMGVLIKTGWSLICPLFC